MFVGLREYAGPSILACVGVKSVQFFWVRVSQYGFIQQASLSISNAPWQAGVHSNTLSFWVKFVSRRAMSEYRGMNFR